MMKCIIENQKFPWWVIPLMALAAFRFEYHTEAGSSFYYDGTGIALFIIGIVSLVLIFGVTKQIQRVLKARNLIERIPRSRFWILLPLAMILPAIGYRAFSDSKVVDPFSEQTVYRWDFHWGDTSLHLWLILGTLAIIFLHTVILTLQEIERSSPKFERE